MNRVRLVALDLDGTLLDSSGSLPEANAAACRAASRRAVIAVATGRRARKAVRLLAAFDFPYYLITCSGARLERVPDRSPLFTAFHDTGLLARAASLLLEAGRSLLLFTAEDPAGDVLVLRSGPLHPHMEAYIERNRDHLRGVLRPPSLSPAALEGLLPADVHFMSAVGGADELRSLRSRIEAVFPSRFNTHVVTNITAPGAVLDVLPAGVSKWRTLMRLADFLGVSRGEIAAVGDDENDREMLREAGVSVAMGNASDSLKSVADLHTAGNDEGGAALALEMLGLTGD